LWFKSMWGSQFKSFTANLIFATFNLNIKKGDAK